jgi:sensor histidine kinase YesM
MHNPQMNRLRKFLPIFTWIGVFLMPILTTQLEGKLPSLDWYIANLLLICSICVIFYIDFYFLVDKFILKRKLAKFILTNVGIGISLTLLDYYGIGQILRNYESENLQFFLYNFFPFSLLSLTLMALSASLGVSIRMTEYSFYSNIKISEIKKIQAETELANLKNQINPHFLFNTLNNIYALSSVNIEKTKETIHDLSHLLRYVIYDTSPVLVPLKGEIAFLKKYIQIERLRLQEKFDIQVTLPENCGNLEIAPLLFLPLIENAFKHGISYSQKSFIHINISLNDDTIICLIINSDHAKKNGIGVGIENTTKRLNLLYSDQYTLQYGTKNNVYETILSIKL